MIFEWLRDHFGNTKGKILALGGGGARGLAHVGVIKALEERGWQPDLITGTSMGAIIGALYAQTADAAKVEHIMAKVIASDAFKDFGLSHVVSNAQRGSRAESDWSTHIRRLHTIAHLSHSQSIFKDNSLLEMMRKTFGNITFDDLKIPFVAVATDLHSGEDIELRSGDIAKAVTASSSIPGVFSPVPWGNMLLVDGCVTKNIPIPEEAETKGWEVLAVSVPRTLHNAGPFYHAVDILARAEMITQYHLNQGYLDLAEGVIEPEVNHIHWADFSKADELVAEGYRAALAWLDRGE